MKRARIEAVGGAAVDVVGAVGAVGTVGAADDSQRSVPVKALVSKQ